MVVLDIPVQRRRFVEVFPSLWLCFNLRVGFGSFVQNKLRMAEGRYIFHFVVLLLTHFCVDALSLSLSLSLSPSLSLSFSSPNQCRHPKRKQKERENRSSRNCVRKGFLVNCSRSHASELKELVADQAVFSGTACWPRKLEEDRQYFNCTAARNWR